ncbi:MAG: Xaa-Pro peptidase family protein [Pseudomonadota bacterium]
MHPTAFSVSNRKIDPTRRRGVALKPDGTPADNDRVEIGPTDLAFDEFAALGITPPDLPSLREYRLERLRGELRRRDYSGLLMFDPLNIRYATDSMNMQLWTAHNPARACYVATDGPVILWDFHGCDHLTAHLPLIDEVRHGAGFFYFLMGERCEEGAELFARQIDQLMRDHSGSNRRLAVDKMEWEGIDALRHLGVEIRSGQQITELARVIKDANEVNAMRCAIAACEAACHEMRALMTRERLDAGLTEVDMWAMLNHGNHIRGGEWIETRILATGPRTNPWMQEAGPRVMKPGELIAFDTDMVGPYGYCCDISRTWLVGEEAYGIAPTPEQRRLYKVAHEHIMTNIEMVKPGVSFRDLTFMGHMLPEEFVEQRYGVKFHGIGLCDEFPAIKYPEDYADGEFPEEYGYLQPGMTLTAEVYIGAVGGEEGIKLEDQILITEDGVENLTSLPFESSLLS